MNKNLMRLAEQAGLYVRTESGKAYPAWLTAEQSVAAYQKFGELVALECAEISWDHWMQFKDCSAHFQIREHFGVK